MLAELDQLANVCSDTTKVVVIGGANDIRLYRELARRGISEYLVTPVAPLQIIEAIAGLYASPDSPPIGRLPGTRRGQGPGRRAARDAGFVLDPPQARAATPARAFAAS